MSIRVRALQNFDNFVQDQEVDLPPEYGKAVVDAGLAVEIDQPDEKAAPPASNKMAAPVDNKASTPARASRSTAVPK